jgi:hypothetical protein
VLSRVDSRFANGWCDADAELVGAAWLGKVLNAHLNEISRGMAPIVLGRMQKLRDRTMVDPLQAPVLDAMEAHVVSSASRYQVSQVCGPARWVSHRPAPSSITTPMRCVALRGGSQRAHLQSRFRDTRFGPDPRGVLVLGERELQASLRVR